MIYRLGVDVGGTNTDAVIIDEGLNLIDSIKVPTTEDVSTGIFKAIHAVVEKSGIEKDKIKYAMLGTTQCTNAIVERKKLCKVGVIRLGSPATHSIEPMVDWPEDLRKAVSENFFIVKGGYEFDGRELSTFDENEIREVARKMKGKVEAIAISCVFSPVREEQEIMTSKIIKEELGDIPVSMSHEVASMGLLERENATILNSALMKVAETVTEGFSTGLKREGVKNAEIYLCQNDGTLMSVNYTKRFPILTVACGPTNSIRGASFLSKMENAIVLDVGGTTTDIGVIVNSFPRESSLATDVGGARTNFRMPDIIAIGLGGGTVIREQDGIIKVGPESVGYKLTEKALVFGGDTLTASDIAVRLGMTEIGDKSKVEHIDKEFAEKTMNIMMEMIEEAIDKMKLSAEAVPVVLVGGGGVIVKDRLKGVSEVIKPDNFPVANALGSAIAQVSGTFERLFILDSITRDMALNEAKEEAITIATNAGADPNTIEIVEVEDVPLAYHPGNATRIKVKAAGNLMIKD
ncbi:hydantoinase/oxoprolinase N-terminal domain-containing protein [Clostridium sediminicola]|uniref:hydantoinase/oxoprolinase N-terminal domain-containing protein n=1 Tax=Clostridium sediminicola TaxID=3114879 RepID=UPI0031F237DA